MLTALKDKSMSTPQTSASRWLPTAKQLATAVMVVAAIGGVAWYFNREPAETPVPTTSNMPDQPRAQPVRVVTASRQPIQAWVFAEGTARSVRREYLTFERAGRVAFVKRGQDGGDLRAGEPVRAGEEVVKGVVKGSGAYIDESAGTG